MDGYIRVPYDCDEFPDNFLELDFDSGEIIDDGECYWVKIGIYADNNANGIADFAESGITPGYTGKSSYDNLGV